MIAAQDHRDGAGLQDLAHAEFDIGVALLRVRMDDVRIAQIDNPRRLRRQIGDVVLMIVSTAVTEGEKGRRFPDAAWAETGTRAELGAEIERCSKHGDIRLDGIPVRLVGVFAEGCDADEWQIEAARFVSVR